MEKSVCALGFFDGVHEAHIQILTECVTYARAHGLKSIALTFERSPAEYFGKKIKYLTSLSCKMELMLSLGIDEVVVLPCNEETLSLSPEAFIDSILMEKLNAKALFCGFNYTFGKNAKGNTVVLTALCKERNIDVTVMPCMTDAGVTVSSTEIRLALSKGEIEHANNLLTRPFEVRGRVSAGKHLGRQLGFPTANIYPENIPDLPYGVYATKTVIGKEEYISVTNVGINPTVEDNSLRVETYISGFEGDIYDEEIKVRFYKFLRPEKKFASVEELKKQIATDTVNSINYFKKLH
ncbi:MAG: bifunctional riboflavin kinase/FAD synthetase [Clostridia bacterium]|nr:bifunctional riboflavin kinase/FAD synthetase [Clostridia bacterium]